jgi:hypothetical protein
VASKFIPLDSLKETREWIALSGKQRELVTFYICESGYDRVASVKKFYKCGSSASVYVTVNRVFGSAPVRAFLALHFAETPQEQFLEQLRRAVANPKLSYPRLQALRLQAKLLGMDASAIEAAIPEGKIVGEKEFEREGKRYKTVVTELP